MMGKRAMKTAKTLRRKGPFRRYISSIYILYPPVYKHTKKDQNAAGRTVVLYSMYHIVLRTERSPVARNSRGATKIVGARVSVARVAWENFSELRASLYISVRLDNSF